MWRLPWGLGQEVGVAVLAVSDSSRKSERMRELVCCGGAQPNAVIAGRSLACPLGPCSSSQPQSAATVGSVRSCLTRLSVWLSPYPGPPNYCLASTWFNFCPQDLSGKCVLPEVHLTATLVSAFTFGGGLSTLQGLCLFITRHDFKMYVFFWHGDGDMVRGSPPSRGRVLVHTGPGRSLGSSYIDSRHSGRLDAWCWTLRCTRCLCGRT